MSTRNILDYKAPIAVVAAVIALAAVMGGLSGQGALAVVLVQPINLVSLVFMALRTRVLSNGVAGFGPAIKGVALSSALLYLLPSRLSELVKPLYLAERCGLPFVRGLALVAVERFVDILIVSLGLGLGALLIASRELEYALAVWGAVALAGLAGMLVLLRRPELLRRVVGILPWRPLRELVIRFVEETRTVIAPYRLLQAVGWGLATWISSFLLVYALLNLAGSIPLSLTATFLVFLAGTVGIAVAIAPGGFGTFETSIVVALNLQGYTVGEALVLSLLLRAANLGFLPAIAAWALTHDGIGLRGLVDKLRALRQPAGEPSQGKGNSGGGAAP